MGQRSFFYHAINTYNDLSKETKNSKALKEFKRRAKKELYGT